MSVSPPSGSQSCDHGHDRNAEQDATNYLGIAYRCRYLVFQAWIAKCVRERIEALHHDTRGGQAIAPRNRQGV
jgi:hypothetical protein